MSIPLIVATLAVAFGLSIAIYLVLADAPAHEALWGVVIAEWGGLLLGISLFESSAARFGVVAFFSVSSMWTAASIRSMSRANASAAGAN